MKIQTNRPIAFILASTNHGTMLVNRQDYRAINNGGYGVGFQLLNKSSFDPEEIDLALNLLNLRKKHFGDGVVALDCGANIGVHTIEWAKLMHDWGEVIAIEAQERIFYALAGNITLNNCFNAKAILAAIGGNIGKIEVPSPNYLLPSSFGSLELRRSDKNENIGQTIDYDNTTTLKMITIDSLKLDRLDFIKIDVEGMEIDALNGSIKSIKKFKPQMIIEKIKSNEKVITELLSKNDYNIFSLGINILAIHKSDPTINDLNIKYRD